MKLLLAFVEEWKTHETSLEQHFISLCVLHAEDTINMIDGVSAELCHLRGVFNGSEVCPGPAETD